MSEPANELELEQQGAEFEPEPSKESAWFFDPKLPAEEEKEPNETPEKEAASTEPPPPSAPVPPVPQAAVPPPQAPPPEFMQYIAPVVQQTAETNATLKQIAQLQMQAMQPPPPPEPMKPDPIDQPEEFAKYMYEQQFRPMKQQLEQMTQQQQFMLADQQRMLCESRNPKFANLRPAIYQMASNVPMDQLAKPGTWDLIYHAAKSYIEDNMPHLLADVPGVTPQPQQAQVPQQPNVQRFPTPKQEAPHIPSGTMGGGSSNPKMTDKFVRQCQKLGQKPEEVLAFAIKEGIDPEELMK
jgi:hypothetical protein